MKLLNARKKLVTLAVASAISGGVMMSAPAQAMNVSQNNVGEVLLFPYYTVKNGFDTVFTVTNTTNRTALFKIRFREALNSREVRDFNVILSPYDHWGAAVTLPSGSSTPVVRTFDKTCTSPQLPASPTTSGTEVGFTNALYSGAYTDGADESIERSHEGYFEVILMGVSTRSTSETANTLEYNAKHDGGVPRDCAKVDDLFLDVATNLAYVLPPENILKGHVTYIDVANGKAIDAEPTAIEDFSSANIVYESSNVRPDMSHGDALSTVNSIANGAVISTLVATGSEDAVSMLLMADAVINEFATGSGAATSWVVTFPTKHHYTDALQSPQAENTALPPFSDWFYEEDASGNPIDGTSCDDIKVFMAGREEQTVTAGGTEFSPAPETSNAALCYEANVIDFNASNVFGTGVNRLAVNTAAVGSAGWAHLSFIESTGLNGYTGLPVIGFAAIMRDQGSASVNYGSSEEHSYVSGAHIQ